MEDKLREEWREEVIKCPEMDVWSSADWWLSKFHSYKTQLIKDIRERDRKLVTMPLKYKDSDANVWREGYNRANDDVINLISNEK